MLKGFWKLTWVEIKVFVREPMGVIGSLLIPVVLFVVFSRTVGGAKSVPTATLPANSLFNPAIFAALFLAISAALSLIAIISIYREGGILKRLRATPLSPVTILGSHVFVKLVFTVIGMALLVLAGRRMFPGLMQVDVVGFVAAVLLSTFGILSLGFVVASIVPTARFAQPIGAAVFYPMITISGLFFPVDRLPIALRVLANILPTTHAVALMQSVWDGTGWTAQLGSAAALLAISAACIALTSKVFRWE